MALKDEYSIKSDRYGYRHKLLSVGNGQYKILQQEKWMTMSIIYAPVNEHDIILKEPLKRYETIEAVDLDGGPYIMRGWTNGEIEVIDIIEVDHQIRLIIKEIKEENPRASK